MHVVFKNQLSIKVYFITSKLLSNTDSDSLNNEKFFIILKLIVTVISTVFVFKFMSQPVSVIEVWQITRSSEKPVPLLDL